jgi:hypothetical protein
MPIKSKMCSSEDRKEYRISTQVCQAPLSAQGHRQFSILQGQNLQAV